jgi:Ca2+-binding RTX toxin-like protein
LPKTNQRSRERTSKEAIVATPYVNSVGYTYVNPTTLGGGRFVGSGYTWDDGGTPAVTLTFSFPTGTAYFPSDYGSGGFNNNEWVKNGASQWFPVNGTERAVIRAALSTWSHFANVNFVETTDTSTNVGELRFAFSNTLGNDEAAHAYYPFSDPSAGDVWFNPDFFNTDRGGIPVGSYDYLTILHEVGHALGLKHTFDTPNAIAATLDNLFYSIMSYTASPWSAHGDNYASFYPTTPMYYDLLAIQGMYGKRAFAAGNNVYTFNDGTRYWQAIHDTGGGDAIVYKGIEATTIDLNPGHFSTLSESIEFQRPNGASYFSRGTVTIGPGTVIETAVGGSGNDILIGSVNGNVLSGGGGNDSLRGGFGNDTLIGGAGNDWFLFNTASNTTTNHDKITDYVVANDTIQLENAVFTKFAATGALNAVFFRAAATAVDGNDFLVYDRPTGNLFYDINANVAGGTQLIVTLTNKPVLTASEFTII